MTCVPAQSVFVRKDDDETAMNKLASEHEENNADPEEIPDPEEIGEEIEVRASSSAATQGLIRTRRRHMRGSHCGCGWRMDAPLLTATCILMECQSMTGS